MILIVTNKMSSREDKDRKTKRLKSLEKTIKRQSSIAKSRGNKVDNPHKFAKRHAMDCGQPGCFLCGNPRKTHKELTIQEKSFDQTEDWDDEN